MKLPSRPLVTFFLIVLGFAVMMPSASAWWNTSYSYRSNINCSFVDDTTPIVLNGTHGFSFNGTRYYIWVNCQKNLSLYFNNASSFTIINGSDAIQNYEVENQSSLSNNPSGVWSIDAGAWGIYHESESSGGLGDSTNIHNMTLSGSVASVSGYIAGGRGPIPSPNYFDLSSTDFSGNTSFTSCVLVKPLASSAPTNSFTMLASNSGGLYSYLVWNYTTPGFQFLVWKSGFTVLTSTYALSTLNTTNFYYFCGVYNSTSLNFSPYVNGYRGTVTTYNEGSASSGTNVRLSNGFYDPNFLTDEFRVYTTAKNYSWINQTFKNLNNTQGYGDLGMVESYTSTDSCVPIAGQNWLIQNSDNCTITSNYDLGGYNVSTNGSRADCLNASTPRTSFKSNLTNVGFYQLNGCYTVWASTGARFA